MTGNLPAPEGVAPAGEVAQDGPVRELAPTPAATLADLAAECVLFTPGCLHTYGGLDADVAAEFQAMGGAVFRFDLACYLFRGIARTREQEAWDRRLFATPPAQWPAVRDHIQSVALVDRPRGRFGFATLREVAIVDRLALRRVAGLPARLPTVAVWVFGYDGTHHRVECVPHVDHPEARAQIVALPIRPETRAMAGSVLGHDLAAFKDALEGP